MEDLRGKVAVVTGAAGGIGRGISRALADEGCHVVVADIQEGPARTVAGELRRRGVESMAVHCDVADRSSVEALAESAWERFGHVELLCNNAGVLHVGEAIDATDRDLHWVFGVNVFGVWHGCSVFAPRFAAQEGWSHILNTGSEHSISFPFPGLGIYTASKHAVLALSEVLRSELDERGIGITILCPAAVATALAEAGKHRHDRFGGPFRLTGNLGELLSAGLDPDHVGRLAVDAVRRGDFYALSHAEVKKQVDSRYEELLAAFGALTD